MATGKRKSKGKSKVKGDPRGKPKSSYVKVPQADPEILERLEVIVDVLSGAKTVSDGARTLELSRNHFQTLKNSALEAVIESLQPRPVGRPSTQTETTKLQAELSELAEDNKALEREVQTQQRIIDNLTDMVREYSAAARSASRTKRRSRSAKKKTTARPSSDDDDRLSRLRRARTMRRHGLTVRDAATAVGVCPATLRRWTQRRRHHRPLALRPGPGPKRPPNRRLTARVARLVRRTRGLAGAEALRRRVPQVSRRQAAAIKANTLTDMERQRKREYAHVTVTRPGVIRGFDAMHLASTYALVSADAAVPFRTSIDEVPHYTGDAVADAMNRDFVLNGAPLAQRIDHASSHKTPGVDEVLDAHKVLRLHGPTYYPRYYGQLERQNREHRAWLRAGAPHDLDLQHMLHVLNHDLLRRSLNWRTSAQCWNERPPILDDRDLLRDEVDDHVQRLQRHGIRLDLANRLAIEHALVRRGYLLIQPGGRC